MPAQAGGGFRNPDNMKNFYVYFLDELIYMKLRQYWFPAFRETSLDSRMRGNDKKESEGQKGAGVTKKARITA